MMVSLLIMRVKFTLFIFNEEVDTSFLSLGPCAGKKNKKRRKKRNAGCLQWP
jgi:hypothetical protein